MLQLALVCAKHAKEMVRGKEMALGKGYKLLRCAQSVPKEWEWVKDWR